MERENGSNNGTPRFWSIRIFGVELTVPENGASLLHRPHQASALLVQSLIVTELPDQTGASGLINFFVPNISRNPAIHSSYGGYQSSRNMTGGGRVTVTIVVEAPNAPPHLMAFLGVGDTNSMPNHQSGFAALLPPSPPHAPHQPAAAVPPPPQYAPNIYPNADANNPGTDVFDLEMVR